MLSSIGRAQLRRDRDTRAEGPRHWAGVRVESEYPFRGLAFGGFRFQVVTDVDAPDHQHLAIQLDLACRL